MECEGFEADVVGLLYGELPEAKRAEAEAHAASCETCGKLSRELGEARRAASILPRRETPPRELDERIALAARFAAESRDVRTQPLRGGGLHVAAASILLMLITGASFGLGTFVNRKPKPISPPDYANLRDPPVEPWENAGLRPTPVPKPSGVLLNHPTPEPEDADAHAHDRDGLDRQQKYNESLLKLAKDERTATPPQPEKALIMLDALIGKAKGVSAGAPWVLEARLERARALLDLGKVEDARLEARAVRDAIARDHAGVLELKPVDDGAADLLEKIGKIR